MPHERRTAQATIYIKPEYLDDWKRAQELAGPRGLSEYVSQAVRARNREEGGE